MKRIIAGIISLAITVCAFSSCDNDNNDEKSKTKISESTKNENDSYEAAIKRFFDASNNHNADAMLEAMLPSRYLEAIQDTEIYDDWMDDLGVTSDEAPYATYEIVKKEKLNDEQLEEIYDDIGDEYYDVDISPMEITDGYCVYLDLSYNNETYTVPIYVYCTDDEWRLYPD